MSFHDNIPYLKHILDAINNIESSVTGLTKKEFVENKDVKDATVRRIEIIGEAVKHISRELKENYPEIAWKEMAGSRDVMIHSYFNVDLDVVWDIIKKDIPLLKRQIQRILNAENSTTL